MNIRIVSILFVFFAIAVVSSFLQNKEMNEMWGDTKMSVDALKAGRVKLFDEGNLSMFIH
ncbi:MAG: hypothetical protein Q8907_15285 [Bacteroidota bacterium]|nr:hypothetical protein [Bacteroidota bacterium]